MIPDPTNVIRAIRNRLSAACDYDVDKIVDQARRHQAESGRTYINLSAGRTALKNTTNQSTHGGDVVVNDESTPAAP
jgi:hypothetical protein